MDYILHLVEFELLVVLAEVQLFLCALGADLLHVYLD